MFCIPQYVVVDDDEIEGTEEVEWTWEGVESSRVQPATFRLTILDNDGVCVCLCVCVRT